MDSVEAQFWRRRQRLGLIFASTWLVFLLLLAFDEVTSRAPLAAKAAALVALAVFVAANTWFWARLCYRWHPVRSLAFIGAWCALAVVMTVYRVEYVWLLIYCAVAAASASREWRVSAGLLAAVVGLALADVLVLGRDLFFSAGLYTAILLTAMSGAGAIFGRRMAESNQDLRVAREEIARLAVSEERLRFARDLHDLLGHSLSTIVLKAELAGRLSDSPERVAAEVRDIERVAREALREVREAVEGYRKPSLAQELGRGRESLSAAGVSVSCEVAGAVSGPLESTLAWAVREGVTNVLRHSRAHRVEIRVSCEGDRVGMEMLDDGVGCDGCEGGNGLRGLRERVAVHDGTVAFGPRPEGGFRLAVTLPVPAIA